MSNKFTFSFFGVLMISIMLLGFKSFPGKTGKEAGIQWMTMQQAIDASKTKPKKIIVDVYTDWCGWCKKMDKDTYENPEIINYLNKHYYAVKFNAERPGDINYKNRVFKLPEMGGRATHEFTGVMMQSGSGYPTTCFFDDELNVIQSIPGYQDAKTLKMIAKYFGENIYKNTDWNKFQSTYVP